MSGVTEGVRQLFINDHFRKVLRENYTLRPFDGPAEITRSVGAEHANMEVKQIFAINVPLSYYTRNPTTYRNIINPNNAKGLYHFQKLIPMMSAIVSDGAFGTVAGGAQQIQGRGGVAPGVPPPAVPNAPAAPRAPNPFNRQQQPGAPGAAAMPIDMRGIVNDDGRSLTMEVGEGIYHDKIIPAVEDLLSSGGKLVAHRYWFFVLDPKLNLSHAIQECVEQNARLYGAMTNMPDEYITHSDIRTRSQFVNNVLIPFVQNGMYESMPKEVRAELNALLMDWRNPQVATTIANLSLSHSQNPANPHRVLGKFGAFSLYLDGVCEEQRDPSNYFALESRHDNLTAAESANIGVAAPNAGGEQYEEEEEDDGEEKDPLEDKEDDLLGIDSLLDADLQEELAEIERQSRWRDREAGVIAPIATEDTALGMRMLSYLKKTPDSRVKAACFPKPASVCHIPSKYFGRRLLNLPLPSMLDYTGKAATLNEAGQDPFAISRKRFKDMPMPAGGADNVRRILAIEMAKLPVNERFEIELSYLTTEEGYHTALMMIAQRTAIVEEQKGLDNARRDIADMMNGRGAISFSDEQNNDFDAGMVFAGNLPEFQSQRITRTDFLIFAKKNAFLAMRMDNSYEWHEVILRFPPGSPDHAEKVREYRHQAGRKFMSVLMNSQFLPDSVKKMREEYNKFRFEYRHGEHLDLAKNQSSYANLKLTLLSRYTGHFRGATNQNVYMLAKLVTLGTFIYDWEVRPNLLQLGPGSVGKSYVYEVLEIMALGGFAVVGHSTDRAYSTGTDFSDETTCMHEAPLSFIGVDRYGRPVLPDEALKDRLTRSRTSTRAFSMDENKNRLTKTEQSMIMGNILMASNDMIPPEESPLMQRFICMVVNEMKRPDFRRGDQSFPLSDLVNSAEGKILIHQEHLLYWYVFLACKLIMTMVLPDVGMDAAELLVREILEKFGERVGVSTDQPRKRKMIMSILTINAIIYAVHMAIFSILAQGATKEKDPLTGELRHKDFDICHFIDEVVKRLYITTEQVVDIMSMLGFMWDTEHRMNILSTVTNKICRAPTKEEDFIPRLAQTRFMPVQNPAYTTSLVGGKAGFFGAHHHHHYRHNNKGKHHGKHSGGKPNDAPDRQGFAQMVNADNRRARPPGSGRFGLGEKEDEEQEEEEEAVAPFVHDARYIMMTGHEMVPMCARIASLMEGNKPSDVEVARQLRDAARGTYEAHPAIVEEWTDEDQQRREAEIAAGNRTAYERAQDPDEIARVWLEAHPEANPAAPNYGEPALGKAASKAPHMLHWKIQMDQPTTPERIVIIEKNPLNSGEFMICVLIEYVIMNKRKDAMMGAITDILSSSCMPKKGGRNFITSLSYVHPKSEEVMPQFLRVVNIPYANKPIIFRFPNIGTLDANAFCSSTIRYAREASKYDPYGVIKTIRASAGIQMVDDDPDFYFSWRHWLRVGLDVSRNEYLNYTPAMESERCRDLMASLTKTPGQYQIQMIENYPYDAVAHSLKKRTIDKYTKDGTHPEIINQLFAKQSDMIREGMKRLADSTRSVGGVSQEASAPLITVQTMKNPTELKKAARKLNKDAGSIYARKKDANPRFLASGDAAMPASLLDRILAMVNESEATVFDSDKAPEKKKKRTENTAPQTPPVTTPVPRPKPTAAIEVLPPPPPPQTRQSEAVLAPPPPRVSLRDRLKATLKIAPVVAETQGAKRALSPEESENEGDEPRARKRPRVTESALVMNF